MNTDNKRCGAAKHCLECWKFNKPNAANTGRLNLTPYPLEI